MKTKILIITGLISGGLLFTSCTKDNALMEDVNFEQTAYDQENPKSPKAGPWSSEDDWEGIGRDEITNYPDPFKVFTTIHYLVKKTSKVNLAVYNKDYELVTILVNKYQGPGRHLVKFDSRGLPPGVYTAELTINGSVYKETMTKESMIHEWNDGPAAEH